MKPETIRTIPRAPRARRRVAQRRASASAWCRPWARCTRAISRWSKQRKRQCDRVVVTLFVNPTQFAPTEDLAAYPRDEEADRRKLAALGVDVLFAPPTAEMYPAGFDTTIVVGGPSAGLETDFRPHFFTGVATIVAKLLIAGLPDRAYFGEKDFQQLLVVKKLVRDLDLPTEIVGCPTVREADGLALSSRNAYLSAEERARAPKLHATLQEVASAAREPAKLGRRRSPPGARALAAAGFAVDYLEAPQRRDAGAGRRPDERATPPARRGEARQDAAHRQYRGLEQSEIREVAPQLRRQLAERGAGGCRDRAARPRASGSASPERPGAAASRWRSSSARAPGGSAGCRPCRGTGGRRGAAAAPARCRGSPNRASRRRAAPRPASGSSASCGRALASCRRVSAPSRGARSSRRDPRCSRSRRRAL